MGYGLKSTIYLRHTITIPGNFAVTWDIIGMNVENSSHLRQVHQIVDHMTIPSQIL